MPTFSASSTQHQQVAEIVVSSCAQTQTTEKAYSIEPIDHRPERGPPDWQWAAEETPVGYTRSTEEL